VAIETKLGNVSRKIQRAIRTSQLNALKRAIRLTRSKVSKDLRKDTKLNSKALNKRMRVLMPKAGRTLGEISIATTFGVALRYFKPLVKMVKGAKRMFEGVSINIGEAGRNLVPGAWLATVKNGQQLVLKRKGKARYPTEEPRSDILKNSALARQNEHKAYLAQVFKENYPIDLGDELKKK